MRAWLRVVVVSGAALFSYGSACGLNPLTRRSIHVNSVLRERAARELACPSASVTLETHYQRMAPDGRPIYRATGCDRQSFFLCTDHCPDGCDGEEDCEARCRVSCVAHTM
ncbi:MAG: hypothetical protein IT379_42750 [Deltaproteobacteria bacterium]|nr:hypothetical protein [Deltaproteobacteria bacterium]